MMEDIFSAPGPILHVPVSTCVACTRENMPCLGVPAR